MSKQFVDVTPKWSEVLPTWLMLFQQAIEGDCSNPDLIKSNVRGELRRMAKAADQWNELAGKMNRVEQLLEAGTQAHGDEFYGPIHQLLFTEEEG